MEFIFRPQLTTEVKSYAAHTPLVTENTLDCSLGVNPYGYPQEAAEAMQAFDIHHLMDYPHSDVLVKALVQYWADLAAVKPTELTAANGSVCGLYYVNSVFAMTQRSEVVGFIPSFTDMIENVKNFGMSYKGVSMRLDENGRADVDDLIAAMDDNTAMVYVDRPNNPTGQTLSLADMKKLLDAAKAKGAFVMSDEAYGDFIAREESSIALWNDYDNLIVVKTFSKGFGLANLRCGYVVAPEQVTKMMAKTLNPYVLSDLHRQVCAAALTRPDHPVAHADDFAAVKQAIRAKIGKKLTMLETDDRVPICTLALPAGGDLQALLMEEDVLTVSGVEFDALDERYVRLRVPTADKVQHLVDAISHVEQA